MFDLSTISTDSLGELEAGVAHARAESPAEAGPLLAWLEGRIFEETDRRAAVRAGRPGPVPESVELPALTEAQVISGVAALLALLRAVAIAFAATGEAQKADEVGTVLLEAVGLFRPLPETECN